jgi:hypothetical protein
MESVVMCSSNIQRTEIILCNKITKKYHCGYLGYGIADHRRDIKIKLQLYNDMNDIVTEILGNTCFQKLSIRFITAKVNLKYGKETHILNKKGTTEFLRHTNDNYINPASYSKL